MPKVEMFFDHTCPYCYRGYGYLMEVLPGYPGIEMLWHPVEAHPKVEEPGHLPYVDLAVQGALFVKDAGGDMKTYNELVFKLYFEEKKAPDDISLLAKCASQAGVDSAAFEEALRSGKYEKALQAVNDYAYEKQKVWAVPTFVSNASDNASGKEKRLDAEPGVGVTKKQVEKFLAGL